MDVRQLYVATAYAGFLFGGRPHQVLVYYYYYYYYNHFTAL